MDANRTSSGEGLKSELARFCLPKANRDPNRKLAWVNSICILFILVGLVGARPGGAEVKTPPPVEEIIPTVIEPFSPPPAPPEPLAPQEEKEQVPDAPPVVAVTLDSPAINFSVPTIGNLVVPTALSPIPPAKPIAHVERLAQKPLSLTTTGTSGDRPKPPYPDLANQLRQEGVVVLLIEVDETGRILSISLKQSAGAILDRSCIDFVRRHWVMPSGPPGRVYEQPFIYSLH